MVRLVSWAVASATVGLLIMQFTANVHRQDLSSGPDEAAFRRRWRTIVTSGAVILMWATSLYFLSPELLANSYPSCPIRVFTGFRCPGCGTTRALHHLLHGRLSEAWHVNSGLFITWPMLGLIVARLLRTRRNTDRLPKGYLVAFAAWILLYSVSRNLP